MSIDPNLISPKKYWVAVALSGFSGIFGLHWFYIGRWLWGLFDLSLLFVAISLFLLGAPLAAIAVFLIDIIHSLFACFRLLTGQETDAWGRVIIYPGQKAIDLN